MSEQFIYNSYEYAEEAKKRFSEENLSGSFLKDVHLDYHHPLEDYLQKKYTLALLKWLTRDRKGKRFTRLEEIFLSYKNPKSPLPWRLLYLPFHIFIDRMRRKSGTSVEEFKRRVSEHRPVIRGIVLAARSVLEYGLRTPQRFVYPLFAVWNFTNSCNLRCRHCYQSAGRKDNDELTLEEKLRLIDELGRNYLPMIAFAGGEPLMSPDLIPVLERCAEWNIHTSLATNGSLITPQLAERLAKTGLKYVEISLDSVRPEKHDSFRGIPGSWQQTVEGMKIIANTPGLRLGVAMCINKENYDEAKDMIEFAIDIGASCFAYFNFIPVGRGKGIAKNDITPEDREKLLLLLNEYIQSGRIGIISTSPQFGRVCLANSPVYTGRIAATHCGSGSGEKARVIAKYLGGCGAGRTYVSIQPNGDITPCVYMPEFKMGNIRKESIKEIIDKSPLWELMNDRDKRWGHCKVCAFKYHCGGCRARAAAYFGDPAGPDPGCIFNKESWQRIEEKEKIPSSP